jgi:hypothetical protein
VSGERLCDALTELLADYGIDVGLGIIDLHYAEETSEMVVVTAQVDPETGYWYDRTDYLDVMAEPKADPKNQWREVGYTTEGGTVFLAPLPGL